MPRLGLTGDVMLGRLVDRYVLADPHKSPAYVWGDTLPLFAGCDLRLVNLECVIAASGSPWQETPKVFHFRARPRAVEALQAARIDAVTLANNHVLDYGYEALDECLRLLRDAGIAVAGTGANLEEAAAPAVLAAGDLRCAVVALTDGEPQWAAGPQTPGIHYVEYDEAGLAARDRERVAAALAAARAQADLVIVSAHVGPNWGPPSAAMRALAHQLIDLGADLYWGHSNHSVQGIELYRGRPICYSTGDFVDDYAVDPDDRNDLSFFFQVDVAGGQAASLVLYPVQIQDFQVRRAGRSEAQWLAGRMRTLCADFGTPVGSEDDHLRIPVLP